MRVLSYNVHGWRDAAHAPNLGRVAGVVRSEAPHYEGAAVVGSVMNTHRRTACVRNSTAMSHPGAVAELTSFEFQPAISISA